MLLPLGTDRSLKRPTLVTYILLVLNVGVFLWQYVMQSNDPGAYREIERSLWLMKDDFALHALISYQFLHANLAHLLGNMLFLYVFGLNVEDRLGRVGFIFFYLAGGVVAGLAHMLDSPSPVIGASGSISAVTGAFLTLFPGTRLRVLLLFFFIGIFWIPAWWIIVLAIAKDLVFQGFAGNDNVARMAHIGGYVFGFGVCYALLAAKILPREPYDLFSIGRHAKRRREFKELSAKGQSAWASDTSKVSKDPSKKSRHRVLDEAALDERAQISSMIAEGDLARASTRYQKAIEHFPDFALSRGDLIALGNHLFKEESFTLAAHAYERMIERFPGDVEAPRTMLMLALINARYLNDPVRAKQLIAQAQDHNLDSQYRALLETLRAELG